MAKIIDGKAISTAIKDELKEKVAVLKAEGTDICLAVIQVGDDPASSVYVRNKKMPVHMSELNLYHMNFLKVQLRRNYLNW